MEDTINRRNFLKTLIGSGAVIGLAALGSGCSGKSAGKNILNFYNYSDYIGKETIPRFERDYNYRVNCDYYSKQDILYAKIKIGVTGYDLIVATDLILRRFIRQNLLIPVEKEKIPNVKDLMPRFTNPPYDPGLKFSIPYLWGTTVIAYNKKYVSEPVTAWKDLWNPKYKGKMSMLDEKREAIGAALIMLGYNPNSTDKKELREAQMKLLEQRPLLKKYTADTYIDELASNELWLAQGWSGDVIQAIRENPDIDYIIPDEGSILWVDCMAIPTGSPHPESARLFMDYILKPEVGAELAIHVGYATPNKAAFDYIAKTKPEIVNDKRIYPPEKTLDRLYFNTDIGDEEKYWNKIWEDIKLGRA